MSTKKPPDVLVSAEVTIGLVAVLRTALDKGQLRGREKKLALAHVEILEKTMRTQQERAKVRLSLQVVANMLRIVLMIIKPDPLIKAAITLLGIVI